MAKETGGGGSTAPEGVESAQAGDGWGGGLNTVIQPQVQMARRRRGPKPYKLVNAFTKDMGSGGGQKNIGYVDKLDAQGISAYLRNFLVSAIINNYDGGDTTPGVMLYVTTSVSWDDDNIITARAIPIAGTAYLPVFREIVFDAEKATGNIGRVYLWAELTDITISDDIEARFVVETWGNFVEFTEA